MKKLILLFSLVLLASCSEPRTSGIDVQTIYKGHRWDIVKLNDSTFVAMPGLNSDKTMKPIMFNKTHKWDYLGL